MSEVQTRPPPTYRGRGSSRGGRGGFSRGGRSSRHGTTNGSSRDTDEQDPLASLKNRYPEQLAGLKEMFPAWSTEDILFALEENHGDVDTTANKISEGITPQWGEVKKKGKDRGTKPKVNDDTQAPRPSARGGRNTSDGARGGRGGRGGAERSGRGRGGGRGNTNGFHRNGGPSTGPPDVEMNQPVKQVEKPPTTTWAQALFAPKTPPPPIALQAPKNLTQPALEKAPVSDPAPPVEIEPVVPSPEPVEEEQPVAPEEPIPEVHAESEPEVETIIVPEPEEIEPPQQLTEQNVERVEDTAPPAPVETAASTVAPLEEPTNVPSPIVKVATPVIAKQPISKGTPRQAFRKPLQQEEGVVMPSNHIEVNRAALQFGSMGLGDDDEDDEVEPVEPVAQPPQPSPITQPIAPLPPTGPSQVQSSHPSNESIPTPRQAPGLPSQPQTMPQQSSPQPPQAPQSMTQQVNPQLTSQFNRYGAPEQQVQAKPFDTFNQMHQQSAQQTPSQPQVQPQQNQQPLNYAAYMQPHQQPSHIGIGVTSAPDQQHYGNYYTDRSQPPGFNLYGNTGYMQSQQAQAQQEAGASQQRASSGLSGGAEPGNQVPSAVSGPGPQQSRYGAPTTDPNSGHGTPSPALPVQQASQSHQQSLAHQQAQQYNPIQYHPYYNQFVHQSYYTQPTPFGGKNMYAYPGQNMYPGYAEQASSTAALGGFGGPTGQGRDSMGSLTEYNRMSASASQQSLPQHSTAGGYANVIPNFLNSRGGIPQDQQQLGTSVGQQQGQQGQSEDLKFGENKPPTGPSAAPSLQGQPGRPGSATSGASGLGPQQTGQVPNMYNTHGLHGAQGQHSYGAGQGHNYSMYSYPYPGSGRHGNSGAGWSGYGH